MMVSDKSIHAPNRSLLCAWMDLSDTNIHSPTVARVAGRAEEFAGSGAGAQRMRT